MAIIICMEKGRTLVHTEEDNWIVESSKLVELLEAIAGNKDWEEIFSEIAISVEYASPECFSKKVVEALGEKAVEENALIAKAINLLKEKELPVYEDVHPDWYRFNERD